MKLRSFGALAVLAGLVLTGCSTSPISHSQAEPVPASRIFLPALHETQNEAVLVVTRDSGALGSACYLGVFLDGKLAVRIGPGEGVSLKVPAGEHLLGLNTDPEGNGLCGIGGMALYEIQSITRPGESRRYRVFQDLGGTPKISPTSF